MTKNAKQKKAIREMQEPGESYTSAWLRYLANPVEVSACEACGCTTRKGNELCVKCWTRFG